MGDMEAKCFANNEISVIGRPSLKALDAMQVSVFYGRFASKNVVKSIGRVLIWGSTDARIYAPSKDDPSRDGSIWLGFLAMGRLYTSRSLGSRRDET